MVALNDLPDEIILGIASLVRVRQSPNHLLFLSAGDVTIAEDLSPEREGLKSFSMVNRRIRRIVLTTWYSVIQLHGDSDGMLKMAQLLRTFRENSQAAAAVRQLYVCMDPISHEFTSDFLKHNEEVATIYETARSVGILFPTSLFPAWDDLDYWGKTLLKRADDPKGSTDFEVYDHSDSEDILITQESIRREAEFGLFGNLFQILLLHTAGLRELIAAVPYNAWLPISIDPFAGGQRGNSNIPAYDARRLLPKLTTLALRPVEEFVEHGLNASVIATLLAIGPNIKELYLESCLLLTEFWPLKTLKNITHLTLSMTRVSASQLRVIVGACEALSTFKYTPCSDKELFFGAKPVEPGEVIQTLLPHAATLKTLCLEYFDTDPHVFITKPAGQLRQFTKLENLWIDGFSACGSFGRLSKNNSENDLENRGPRTVYFLQVFLESLPSSLETFHWSDELFDDMEYLEWIFEKLERFPKLRLVEIQCDAGEDDMPVVWRVRRALVKAGIESPLYGEMATNAEIWDKDF
ncbi:hypothetical protein Cob_v008140 [Colletotrichum orbiculare MAFF 240422]|uniref:Uncharacterized protein n=1 Tax=Colletotrichum orbiculare (strain 104-T / ATCC 96160 / CBS 514.97 / LARS 414 / MAFF 240422) TaxID=1213857 RepID=A0A484FNG8_COLOR|nr:hypothetical protein Cob_v008140 [Colletotrichum orbiculare MAFF 240422]